MTGMTPSYGGRTPMYGSQTPLYDGSRTPHYGAATPSHDGSSTPGRSSAWDPANTNTPSRSVFLCIAAGDRCCSCCDMESAYVTRLSALLWCWLCCCCFTLFYRTSLYRCDWLQFVNCFQMNVIMMMIWLLFTFVVFAICVFILSYLITLIFHTHFAFRISYYQYVVMSFCAVMLLEN